MVSRSQVLIMGGSARAGAWDCLCVGGGLKNPSLQPGARCIKMYSAAGHARHALLRPRP